MEDPRILTVIAVAAVSGALWWLMFSTMGAMDMPGMEMPGMEMPGMEMPMAMDAPISRPAWSASLVLGTAVMWVLMMLAMMLPAMAPVLAAYAKLAAKEDGGAVLALRIFLCAIGYFSLWALVSVALAVAQLALRESAWFTMAGTMATPHAAAILLLIAGLWQMTPVKDACLRHCRHPLTFLIAHWKSGVAGALRIGAHHGAYCVGCCIALMGLMFVFGAMNPWWMAAIAVYFLAEKLLPGAEIWGRWVGFGLIAAGLAVFVSAIV